MAKKSFPKGELLHSCYEQVHSLEIILSGSVKVSDSHRSFTLSAGSIIGGLETHSTNYNYNYEIAEDTVLFDYPYTKSSDLEQVIAANPKIISNLHSAASRTYLELYHIYQQLMMDADSLYKFMVETYSTYLDLCLRYKVPNQVLSYMDELSVFTPEDGLANWEPQFVNAIRGLDSELKKALLSSSVHIGCGLILSAIDGARKLLKIMSNADDYLQELSEYIISGNAGDYFDLYSNLLFHVSKNPFADTTTIEATVSKLIIYMTDSPYVDIAILHKRVQDYRDSLKVIENSIMENLDAPTEMDAYEAITGSLEAIMNYARFDPEKRENFRSLVDQYKLLTDKNSGDDLARKLRRSIADAFYDLYETAFFNSIGDAHIPAAVKMFFNFGYVDEELCGHNNAATLFEIVNTMKKDTSGVLITIYDWLMMIYNGTEQPSKNEFDLDYPAFLRDQKNNGYITAEKEAQLINDRNEKVHFEIANLFAIGNRMTFGHVSTFCPLLSEHNILKPLNNMLITIEKLQEALDKLRSIDFSCFYREIFYSNPSVGVPQEYINVEVLPHFILMPNVGSRGVLWQEISGSKKDTHGRIMISAFITENLDDMVTKLAGSFKWEMCKTIQGVHWNDVSDPSLTADYCDYMQFIRKNRELSPDAKDKVKQQLARAKNNYRDAFIMDYVQWVKFESQGSPRLNKVSRAILFKYAPFSANIRANISGNPMYQELIDRRKLKLAQKKHQLDILFSKIKNAGLDVPRELQLEMEYLDK